MLKPIWLLIAIAFGFVLGHDPDSFGLSTSLISKPFTLNISTKLSQAINPTIKVKQSEAKAYTLGLNTSQQAFYLEKQRFARSDDNLDDLIVGTKPTSTSYKFSTNFINQFLIQNISVPNEKGLKAFTGGVFVTKPQGSIEYSSLSILCESNNPTLEPPPPINTINGFPPLCPVGYSKIYPEFSPPSNESLVYIRMMNRGQQAFYLEKLRFATTFSDLVFGIDDETENYSYKVVTIDRFRIQNIAISKKNGLITCTGGVFIFKLPSMDEVALAVLCKSNKPTRTLPPRIPLPVMGEDGYVTVCPVGYSLEH